MEKTIEYTLFETKFNPGIHVRAELLQFNKAGVVPVETGSALFSAVSLSEKKKLSRNDATRNFINSFSGN